MKTRFVILIVGGLLAAEFAFHHQIARTIKAVASDLGLTEKKVQPRAVLPEGAVQSNEFAFVFEGIASLPVEDAAAGVVGVPGQPGFWIAEMGSLAPGPYKLDAFLAQNGFANAADSNGGIRQIIDVEGTRFALGGFNEGDCYFGAVIDLDHLRLVDRFPCLPDSTDRLDMKGFGGGYAVVGKALYMALGTASDAVQSSKNELAQDLTSPYGKILRYEIATGPDGVALQNRQIYTRGHRNPQGMLVLGDLLLAVEHGPKGGDEINLIVQDNNYGWPLYSAGSGYDELDIPSFAAAGTGFTAPIFSFVPSIGISDLSACPTIIRDKKGGNADCLIVSALRDEAIYIVMADLAAKQVYSVERVPVGARVREVFLVDDTMYLVPDFSNIIRVTIEPL